MKTACLLAGLLSFALPPARAQLFREFPLEEQLAASQCVVTGSFVPGRFALLPEAVENPDITVGGRHPACRYGLALVRVDASLKGDVKERFLIVAGPIERAFPEEACDGLPLPLAPLPHPEASGIPAATALLFPLVKLEKRSGETPAAAAIARAVRSASPGTPDTAPLSHRETGDLVRKLGAAGFDNRRAAFERLAAGGASHQALIEEAAASEDPEIAQRARDLLAEIYWRENRSRPEAIWVFAHEGMPGCRPDGPLDGFYEADAGTVSRVRRILAEGKR